MWVSRGDVRESEIQRCVGGLIMPLPFILGGIALAAAGYGAKKGYDGYQDKTLANEILSSAKGKYEKAKSSFDITNKNTTEDLENLGKLQLKIGADFNDFRRIADDLLKKMRQSGHKDITVNFPKHQLDKIDGLAFSTTAYLGKIAGGGVTGVAAAYAVYGGVMALAAASTGTPIAALSGAAAYNATMAAIGGGSLAAGGFGMAGGALVLGSVVAAPIIAIAGWAFASHAEEALNDARKTRDEVDTAISKMDKAQIQLKKTSEYVKKIHIETERIFTVFRQYFEALKTMNACIEAGYDLSKASDEIIEIIENGYKIAAILTDIITTPLFKPKKDSEGKVIVNENNVVILDADQDDMQILNIEALDDALDTAKNKA